MKNEKGITLAALVITIIILLIISSIAVYSGIGTIRYAKYNKAKSEMELMQNNVNSWYEEYSNVEVKEEEITEGKTKEEIKATKQQEVIEKYGVLNTDSSCDQTALTKTVDATGITKSDYRFLSADYLKDNLGMDSSFEFLINIPERTVILFNGLTYNGKTYYTADDFAILNVPNTPISSVTFQLAQGEGKEIIIYNLKFRDNIQDVNVNKFRVQYRKDTKDDSDTGWSDVTDKIVKCTYNKEQENETTIAYDGYKFSASEFGEHEVRITTTDNAVANKADVNLLTIRVGDYVKYVASTNREYKLTSAASGHGNDQTLNQEYTKWRVMNINSDGSLDLVADVKSTNKGIYFQGAIGYNNGVYLLNYISKYLYENEEKGITARSINIEDIESHMNSAGLNAKKNNLNERFSALTKQTYVKSINSTEKTITYEKSRSYYPDIYRHEIGAGINTTSVLKKGDKDSDGKDAIEESQPYYEEPTTNTSSQADELTAKYTAYSITVGKEHFEDYENNDSLFYKSIFQTDTNYWLASREVECYSDPATVASTNTGADWGFRVVNKSRITVYNVYRSYDASDEMPIRFCPVVTLNANVKVKKSATATTSDGTPHEVMY